MLQMDSEERPNPPEYDVYKPEDVTMEKTRDIRNSSQGKTNSPQRTSIQSIPGAMPAYRQQPHNVTCPTPLPRDIAHDEATMFSGSKFHPVLHQSRRDMYGGDLRRGIPTGFQNILYDISNCVLKENNYGRQDPSTKKVFNYKEDIYECIAAQLEYRLTQRMAMNGKKTGK